MTKEQNLMKSSLLNKMILTLLVSLNLFFTPCGMGVRIQPTPALRRVVRGDYLKDMSYPLPPAHCMQGLLSCNVTYELG